MAGVPPVETLVEKKDQLPTGTDGFIVPGKNSWPELVGTNGEEAVVVIKKENPLVDPIIVTGNIVHPDFINNRVRVFVDGAGIVVPPAPRIG